MALPTKTSRYSLKATTGFDDLVLEHDVDIPKLGDYDCLVRIEAVSLNFRDLIIAKGTYPFPATIPVVPGSDASATVLATGPRVTQFTVSDHVCTQFSQSHQSGPVTPADVGTTLGGAVDGTLTRYAVFPEWGLVGAPGTMSSVEAATLSCAPLTAWNALMGLEGGRRVGVGEWVLTQGSGGVSCAAIQFARAAGARVIATTSTKTKEAKLKALGATHVINYREDANWGETAKKITGGRGVDHVVEIGGPNTMRQSLKAVRCEGVISVVGFVGGTEADGQPGMLEALTACCTVRGLLVGSRAQFREMVRAIEMGSIPGVVDERVFGFEELKKAYQYVWDQKHFGNVVVKVGGGEGWGKL